MLYISDIELPKGQDAEAFETFMRDEYVPAVLMQPTRVGVVEQVELLHQEAKGKHRFLWLVRWNGMEHEKAGFARIEDDAVARKLEEFGARIDEPVPWEEVANRSAGG